MAKIYLEHSGEFSVDTEASAKKAIGMLRERGYDAIISDFQMPGMNGIDFLKKVRTSGNTIPFIIFTGRGREEIVIQALNEGADSYIQKGGESKAQFTELAHKIRQSVQQRRAEINIKDLKRREAEIINFLPDATFAIDTGGVVIAWNRAMEKMTGIRATQILEKGDYEYALPFYRERRPILIDLVLRDDPATTVKYQNVIRDQKNLIAEVTIPHFNNGKGASLWFTASPLYDTRGTIIGAIESIRDITDRKRAEKELLRKNEELQAAYEELTTAEEELRQNYDEMSKSQAELRLSEERYRNVVEDQTEFICRFTPGGRLTFVNEAYCRYFGLDKESCIGFPHTVVIPPDDLSLMKHHLSALSPENPVGILDHRIIMPFGEVRWQRWSDRAIFDPDGKIIEYQSVGRDTTERMETEAKLKSMNDELMAAYEQLTGTEEELRQNYDEMSKSQAELRLSEERYRNVVEDQTEFISRFRPDGTHVFVNEAYCRYFGLKREEIIGKKFAPRIPAEDRSAVTEHFVSLTKTHPVGEIRHRIIMPSGEMRWQRWSDRAIFDPDGKSIEFQSVGRDISDIIKAEEALRESEERYRAFFTTSMDCVFITSVDGLWLDFNDSAVLFFGYASKDELQKVNVRNLYENSIARKNHLAFIKEKGYSKEYPVNLKKKDGTIINTLITTVPIKDNTGTVVGFQGTIRDITERKQAEKAIHQANKKLNLLSGVTRHDINNQLSVLQGYLAILEMKQPEPSLNEYVQKSAIAAQRISTIIQFTKEYECIGINSPAWQDYRTLVDTASKQASPEQVMVKNDLPAGAEVFADPLIVKVFYNLIDNAVRYGGKITTIWFSAWESGGNHLIICEDDGNGIPIDEKERIFDRGFGKNTGLGLFLAREILDITGITIKETGTPGKGARFEMTVPDGSLPFCQTHESVSGRIICCVGGPNWCPA